MEFCQKHLFVLRRSSSKGVDKEWKRSFVRWANVKSFEDGILDRAEGGNCEEFVEELASDCLSDETEDSRPDICVEWGLQSWNNQGVDQPTAQPMAKLRLGRELRFRRWASWSYKETIGQIDFVVRTMTPWRMRWSDRFSLPLLESWDSTCQWEILNLIKLSTYINFKDIFKGNIYSQKIKCY